MEALWRGTGLQRLRLVSGLILFAFAATHFLNHALGLVSIEAMVTANEWRVAVTGSQVGRAVLVLALLAHVAAAIHKLARRRTLRMPAWEVAQIGLGFAIPFLLLPHVVNTEVAYRLFDVDTSYPYVIARIWAGAMPQQTLLLLIVWLHGCIGLHFWLRLAPGYARVKPVLAVLAVAVPILALAGVTIQGRNSVEEQRLAARFGATDLAERWQADPGPPALDTIRDRGERALVVLAGLLVLGGLVRWGLLRRSRRIPVQYVGGPRVLTHAGPTLLEISRQNGIPHLSVCGGRGRCSTCRVLVTSEASSLSEPSEAETATLRAVAAPPNVRLACQARPRDATSIMQILRMRDAESGLTTLVDHPDLAGVERDTAILFIDIRGFTAMTEKKLAWDVVFVLNQFFDVVGRPITELGGTIGNYAGDGVMALFTNSAGMDAACRAAVTAAAAASRAVGQLNHTMAHELPAPLRIAMGLHAGPLVFGRLGYAETRAMSVVGPAVNLASRLESLAKSADAELVVSATTARRAGLDPSGLRAEETAIRGSAAPMAVLYVEDAGLLPERLKEPVAA